MTDLIANTNSFGILALLVSAIAAGSLRRRDWLAIAVLLAIMAMVIATGLHWLVHDRVRTALMKEGLYRDHLSLQLVITAFGASIFTGLGLWIVYTRHGARRWAALTTLAMIALFCVQALSVHAVDAFLGMKLGPMMVIGWLWGGGALTIMAVAIIASKTNKL